MESTPPSLRHVVDPVNSVAWFTMDALWVVGLEWPAYVAAALTVVTGVWLMALGWREGWGSLLADLGLSCWIVMNTVWLVYDMNDLQTPRAFAVSVAILGAVFIVTAAWHSEDVRRLRIYRRQG